MQRGLTWMTILGSIQDGLSGDYTLLATKSLLDGFAALAPAASMGWGVLWWWLCYSSSAPNLTVCPKRNTSSGGSPRQMRLIS
ncbi:MAG: DUF554 family protein [Candidatus Entotheonellia bacterium]